MKLKNRAALVTGAGSGIGKAAAMLMAREGAKVGVLSHTEEQVRKTADEINRAGGEAIPLIADVGEPDQMERAVARLAERWNRLDIVFANAGINGVWAPIEELKPEEWGRTINTNLTGTFLTIKYAVPYLKRQGGSIIVTASVNGTRIFSNVGATAYSCTKAGQLAMTQMLAVELARSKIRVNVICPGAIDTQIDENTERRDLDKIEVKPKPEPRIPLTRGKPGTSEQVAELVLFLASDASSHITGTPIWIDGAESLVVG